MPQPHKQKKAEPRKAGAFLTPQSRKLLLTHKEPVPINKWEGTVLEVYEHSFLARLTDIDGSRPDEEAEIIMKEVSEDELSMIEPGAMFDWVIQYRDTPKRVRESFINFREPQPWSAEEVKEIEREAKRKYELFGLKPEDIACLEKSK